MPTLEELGQKVKAKYPGAYDDVSDADLGRKVQAKYPGAYDDYTEAKPDAAQRALDYRTGNDLVDAPLGVLQGAVKGLRANTLGAAEAIHKIPGVGQAADAIDAAMGYKPWTQADSDRVKQETAARGIGQGTGKFLESAAEYALPASKVGALTKGAGLVARAAGQAAVGGGVAAAQSGGDPVSTGTGVLLGAGGEVVGAAGSALKKLINNRAPTGANYAAAFKATPSEKQKIITPALDLLKNAGVQPGKNPEEMAAAVDQLGTKLSADYKALPADIRQRPVNAGQIIDELRKAQTDMYVPGTKVVASAHKNAYGAIESQIEDVTAASQQSGGALTVDQLDGLKRAANSRTNFNDPEKSIYMKIGNAYRNAQDTVAPELRPINKDWAQYSKLDELSQKALDQMRGASETGLSAYLKDHKAHAAGAAAGGAMGYQMAGGAGAAVGSVIGGIVGPKLSKTAGQALQNAIDNGSFQALTPAKQKAVTVASKIGNNAGVLRLLGQSGTEALATGQ